jgi:hypothetical protein
MSENKIQLTEKDVEQLAAKAEQWFAGGDGRRDIEEAFQLAENTSTRLSAERIVDIQAIKIPLSI